MRQPVGEPAEKVIRVLLRVSPPALSERKLRPAVTTAVVGARTAVRSSVAAVGRLRVEAMTRTSEERLSQTYAERVESGLSTPRFLVQGPLRAAAVLPAIVRLPHRVAVVTPQGEGAQVHANLTRPGLFGTPFGISGIAVLDVPVDGAEYALGPTRQTLRRKARSATRAGITYRLVTDPAERRDLLDLADECERRHRDEQYRVAEPDNSDLLDVDLWLVAFDAGGTPVLLSVTPTQGEWGSLRYFRTLGEGRAVSDSRYLMTQALVEELSRRGVRNVFDASHPAELPNGLRHFQRMVGFRLCRVSVRGR